MTNPTRVAAWLGRAHTARDAFEALSGTPSAMARAYMASTCAALDGWASPAVAAHLAGLRLLQNPDGGYGLNATADAFQDSTTNPATTTYTVTMAHHVGPVLLDAYLATTPLGTLVPFVEVQQQVALVAGAWQHVTTAGKCLAYSRSGNDYGGTAPRSTYQVHNVNATAAAFLQRARSCNPPFGVSGMATLIVDMVRHLTAAYKPAWSGWPYMAGTSTVVQDRDHQSATAEGAYAVAYPLGRECAYMLMTTTGAGALDPLAHMRLVSLPPGPGSMSAAEPDQTQWLVLGDNWLTEFDGFVTAQAARPANTDRLDRLAQAAYYAARAWEAASA